MTIRKMFDKDGNEVQDAAKAESVHELELDANGKVIKESIYKATKAD